MNARYEENGRFFDTETHKKAYIQLPRAAALATVELYGEFADVPVLDLARLRDSSDEALPPILRIRGNDIVPEVTGPDLVVFEPKHDSVAAAGVLFSYHMARSPIIVGERKIPDAVIIGQPSTMGHMPGMAFAAAGDELLIAQASGVFCERRVLTSRFESISSIYGGFRDIYQGIRKIQRSS